MKNFITDNRKGVKFCFSLPIGPKKIVQQENNNILISLTPFIDREHVPLYNICVI